MSREGAGSRDGCDGSWLTAELGTAPTAPGTGDAALPHRANEPFLPFQHQHTGPDWDCWCRDRHSPREGKPSCAGPVQAADRRKQNLSWGTAPQMIQMKERTEMFL